MALSRKHYTAIADTFKRHRATPDMFEQSSKAGREFYSAQNTTLKVVAEALADYFKLDNPNFDRGRFLRACGAYEEDDA